MRRQARADFGEATDRDLFVAGVALYWAEGAKDKPWRRNGRVILINSDPDVLALFLRWLDLLGVPEEDRTYRLNIHESAEVTTHEPLVGRATRSADRQLRSSILYDCIEGWWSALIDAGNATL